MGGIVDHNTPQYEDFGLFLGYLDHSSVIRLGTERKFSRSRIEEIREHFSTQCKLCYSEGFNSEPGSFFKPQFATSFGHIDDMAFVFMDDFGKISHLASCAPQLEHYTIAYPFSSSSKSWAKEDRKNAFPPIKEMLDWQESNNRQERPLLTVTHFKFSGILTLSLGLNAQFAILSLIKERISNLLDLLLSIDKREYHKHLFTEHDVDNVQFAFLDPVSTDDLVLIGRSTNYTLNLMAVTAIRKLTFSDLWDHICNNKILDLSLFQDKSTLTNGEFSPADFLNLFSDHLPNDPTNQQIGVSNNLDSNHICSSSYTTLAACGDISNLVEDAPMVNGHISARVFGDICPGHEKDVSDWLRWEWSKTEKKTEVKIEENQLTYVLPGKHDLDQGLSEDLHSNLSGVIPTSKFFEFLSGLFTDCPDPRAESGFLDINTSLQIPIPRFNHIRKSDTSSYNKLSNILEPNVNYTGHADVMRQIEKCGDRLVSQFGLSKPAELHKNLLNLQFPASARGMTIRLFNEFVTSIKDPLLFDSVLDLYDSFKFLHKMIITLPKTLSKTPEEKRAPYLNESRRLIVEYVEALRDAFLLRIHRSSPRKEESYSDIHGSLTNLLNAGETAIKCAIGFLRFSLNLQERTSETVCGLVSAHVNQRATARIIRFPDQSTAIVRIDIAHLFQPEHLARVLHEVAHLYFEEKICSGTKDLWKTLREANAVLDDVFPQDERLAKSMFIRLSELFADAFVLQVIFGGNISLFRKYYLLVYNSVYGESIKSSKEMQSTREYILQSLDVLYRLFLIQEYLINIDKPYCYSDEIDAKKHCEDFVLFGMQLKEILVPLRILPDDDCAQLLLLHSKSLFPVVKIVKYFLHPKLANACSEVDKICRISNEEARKVIMDTFKRGVPFPLFSSDAKMITEIDEFRLVFQSVYFFIQQIFDRDINTLKSSFDIVDGDCRMSPKEKKDHFRMFSVLMKSLWHISTRQRVRRLHDIMKEGDPTKS